MAVARGSKAPRVWSVTQEAFRGFLARAELVVLLVAPRSRLRFSPAVAKYFTAEYGDDVRLGTFDRAQVVTPKWLLRYVDAVFADEEEARTEAPDGYYLFRRAAVLGYHAGTNPPTEVASNRARAVLAAVAEIAARSVDPLDAATATDLIDFFESIMRPDAAGAKAKAPRPEIDPYAVLKVPPTATRAEVKAARDAAAVKNHPDRVSGMSEELQELANRRTREVNAAYAAIKKLRGWS